MNRDTEHGQLHTDATPWHISFSRRLRHSPERVWEAITNSDQLDAWFPTRVIGDRVAGAPLRFEFRKGEGEDFDGEMLVFDPPKHLSFRWGDEILRFDIRADGGGSVLDVDISFDDKGKAARDAAGWHVCLDDLATSLDGGEPQQDEHRWKPLFDHYVATFPPEASTIGPPEGM
jgi:uncharacterized protein YndB with AHSA1/START domain